MSDVNSTRPPQGRWTIPLAHALFLLVILILGITLWQTSTAPLHPSSPADVVYVLSILGFPAVGWLIAVRRPDNPLGWILLCFPLVAGIGSTAEDMGIRSAQAGSEAAALYLLGGGWTMALGYWLFFGPAIMLFPDGRFYSRLFRWVLWGSGGLLLLLGIASFIGTGPVCVDRFGEASGVCIQWVQNPLGFMDVGEVEPDRDAPLVNVIMFTLLFSFLSILLRYRRSSGEVRRQIKWVAWASVAGMLCMSALYISEEMLALDVGDWLEVFGFMVISVGLSSSIGVAILRYRLYAIDRIISRSAAYAIVATVLGAVYALSVILIQRILPVEGNALGVVLSTLIVAALFNPLRRRVQDVVDQRFYRSRYDAERVLDAFADQLRSDVQLKNIQAALLGAAQETVKPTHLSLWVHEGGAGNSQDRRPA